MTLEAYERAGHIQERIKQLKRYESFIQKLWSKTNDDEIKDLCSVAHELATELIERNNREFENL